MRDAIIPLIEGHQVKPIPRAIGLIAGIITQTIDASERDSAIRNHLLEAICDGQAEEFEIVEECVH